REMAPVLTSSSVASGSVWCRASSAAVRQRGSSSSNRAFPRFSLVTRSMWPRMAGLRSAMA
ncbi:DUF6774 domain-containing protein, partial [Dysosmobacter welbionis]